MSKQTNRVLYFMGRYGVSHAEAVKMVKSEWMFEKSIHDGSFSNAISGAYLDALDARPSEVK
jgi:hypothetical protein